MEQNEDSLIPELIVNLCTKRLPKYYKLDPSKDIQVLCPMHKGETGAMNLNAVLQKALNHNTISLHRGGIEYKLNDKVMQIKNNYDKDVYNGDIGIISSINLEDRTLTVTFDEKKVCYDLQDTDELILAYACTIHKAQGSEYPVVIMPLTMSHYGMLQRNLIYTGITRAKKLLVLIGSKEAIQLAIKNNKITERNTALCERLKL